MLSIVIKESEMNPNDTSSPFNSSNNGYEFTLIFNEKCDTQELQVKIHLLNQQINELTNKFLRMYIKGDDLVYLLNLFVY